MVYKTIGIRITVVSLALISIFLFVMDLRSEEIEKKIMMLQAEIKAKNYTFTVGRTSVSELPLEKLCLLKEPKEWQKIGVFDKGMQIISGKLISAAKLQLPSSFDWRSSNKVTPVKNQRNCGSCWDFATIGSYESAIAIFLGEMVDLSEQYILDCNSAGYSCSGGWWVFNDLRNGVPLENCYPYAGIKGTCKQNCTKYYPLENWYYVGTTSTPSVDEIKNAIYQHGPVAAAVQVTSFFQNYTGGVFNACSTGAVNHGVVLVGWNDNGGYWILKNSWTANWGENGYMRIKYGCSRIGYAAAYGIPKANYIQVPGLGWEGQGAGISIANLDGNPRPEMVLMAYDNPSGANSFRYKIGWNLNTSGVASSWSQGIQIPGLGWEGQGAGISIVNLDGNPRPEMILMAYDNPSGNNSFRYKIGWNLNASGVTSSWSQGIQIPGLGWEGQGAGISIVNLDGNPRPEMILMAYDNPSGDNSFRYKIGWNLNTAGVASSWSQGIQISGLGWEGQGAGISIVNLDGNPRPEMILMAYDNPSGSNSFRYKIGWNLNIAGVASSWSQNYQIPGVGYEGQGADIAVYNLDSNQKPEFIFMAYDNPAGDNSFRYKILFNPY